MALELVVERCAGEVDAQERSGYRRGQPDPVDGKALLVGQSRPFEMDQQRGLLDLQSSGHHSVGPLVEDADATALDRADGLHGPEEAVCLTDPGLQRTVRGEPREPAAMRRDDGLRPQLPECLAHRAPADLVLGGEIVLPRERLAELPAVQGVLVAAAGPIGFVGLMMPHIVRLFVGGDHRRVLPTAALGGAVFLVWADIAARTIAAPTEIPVGVLTALCGGPFLLWLMRRDARRITDRGVA
ncbi:Vitamin B12 import system permease protein BtuC [Streptomyces sp. enrichment culture]